MIYSKEDSISLYLEIYKDTITTPEGETKPVRDYEYLVERGLLNISIINLVKIANVLEIHPKK